MGYERAYHRAGDRTSDAYFVLCLMQASLCTAIGVDDPRRFLAEDAALARELDLLLVAVDERDAEFLLEGEDVLAQGRLGDVQALGCLLSAYFEFLFKLIDIWTPYRP